MLGYRYAPAGSRVPWPGGLTRLRPAARSGPYPPMICDGRRAASRVRPVGPKSFIHHFGVKALLALIESHSTTTDRDTSQRPDVVISFPSSITSAGG